MTEFVLSLVFFMAAHVVPTRPAVRRRLVGTFGERAYLAAYSIASVLLLAWVVLAAVRAPYVPLWVPADWTYVVPIVAMPFALALIGAGLAVPNPLSVSLRRSRARPVGGAGVGGMRHPVLWGFGVWALSHVPPNGDAVSVVLFGGLALFAFGGMKMLDRRRRRELGEARWTALAEAARRSSFAVYSREDRTSPAAAVIGALAGIAVYLLLLFGGHAWLFGADPLASLR